MFERILSHLLAYPLAKDKGCVFIMLANYRNNEFSTTALRPYQTSDGRYTCMFQGELVNELLLRTKLEQTGIYLQSTRLEELLIELYCFSGDHFVEILCGKFIFIIFDHEEKTLTVARDRYGTSSLYYQLTDDGIVLATEIADFKKNNVQTEELNQDTLCHYFSCGYFPEEETYVKNVKHVPAGCLVKYDDAQGMSIQPFADMLVIEGARERAVEESQIQQVVTNCIQTRIPHGQMAGMFYTGRADELIVATTMKLTGCQFKLFMADFGGEQLADSVLEPHLIRRQINAYDYWESANCITQTMGVPLADPRLPVDYLLAELASKQVDMMIATDGADLLFGADQTLFDWVMMLRNELIFTEQVKRKMLQFEGAAWHALVEPYLIEVSDLGRMPKWQTLQLNTRLKASDTLKTEKITMAYDLKARYPFLDDEILNIASFLTGNEKRSMFMLKQAFKSQISNFGLSPKTNPQKMPLAKWIRTDLYARIKEKFESEVAQEYFDQEVLMNMLTQHRKRLRDFSKQIWAVVIFVMWLEKL